MRKKDNAKDEPLTQIPTEERQLQRELSGYGGREKEKGDTDMKMYREEMICREMKM